MKSKRPGLDTKAEKKLRDRLTILRGARALIAMSIALGDIDRKTRRFDDVPIITYRKALERLGSQLARFGDTARQATLARKIIDAADEIYNETAGADDWSPDAEERALERADDYIEDILYDLGISR